ncbi:hypothetical protein EMCRGX_G012436 [Ephydatia muelleri]
MRYHITSVHGIKALQQGSKKEEMGSSCSTNTASATTSVKGAGSMDKFVQPVTVMKGEKLDRANELLVNALTANLLPSALLDSPEFRDLLGFISSGTYIPPHRTKVTELIDHQYQNMLTKIKMLMANAPSVSITTDAASMHTGDSYVAVTAHWLDPQWNMMSCVLGVSMSNASDQGANFVAAVRLLIEEGVGEEQVRCSCHKLQLSIKNALEDHININNSPMLLDALRKRQHDGNDLPCLLDLQNQQDEDKEDEDEIISEEEDDDDDDDDDNNNVIAEGPIPSSGRSLIKLIKDICTRWNSTLYMLQRCLLLKNAINHVLAEAKLFKQLKTEMINVLGVKMDQAEPPAKKPACSAEEEDFNLLFGQKEDEGLEPVEADDLLKVSQSLSDDDLPDNTHIAPQPNPTCRPDFGTFPI